jgi:hypothetical protein
MFIAQLNAPVKIYFKAIGKNCGDVMKIKVLAG